MRQNAIILFVIILASTAISCSDSSPEQRQVEGKEKDVVEKTVKDVEDYIDKGNKNMEGGLNAKDKPESPANSQAVDTILDKK